MLSKQKERIREGISSSSPEWCGGLVEEIVSVTYLLSGIGNFSDSMAMDGLSVLVGR